MRTLYLLGIISVGFTLASCTSVQSTKTSVAKNHSVTTTELKKDPLTVAFYTKGKPKVPYKIIGEQRISRFNVGGNKRHAGSVRDGMCELAAAMGGDAVIDVRHDDNTISGKVVAFEQESKQG